MGDHARHHFSHEHMLIPIEPDGKGKEIKCQACDWVIEDSFYGCHACEFFLHAFCFDVPRSMKHPSHPSHALALFPTPTYPMRSCLCDACGLEVKFFSYACAECEFDLHVVCANLPQTFVIEHDECPHELKLVFEPPIISSEDETNHEAMLCYICDENILSYWLYCSEDYKQFRHLACILSLARITPLTETHDGGGGSKVVSVQGKDDVTAAEDNMPDENEDVLKVISMMERM